MNGAIDFSYVKRVVDVALEEDVGNGDLTTMLTVRNVPSPGEVEFVSIVAKAEGILAGQDVSSAVFRILAGGDVLYATMLKDGDATKPGAAIAAIKADPRVILTGERVALNFLQRMSGIATLTDKYVQAVKGTKAKIVDTRKTTPGLRRLEKYAVTVGGGFNHRFGLDDGILIKDNHIVAAGGITAAVTAAKQHAPHTLKIEVEVANLDQLQEALKASADVIMLDNMDVETMRRAVEIVNGRVLLEASGGVTLDSVRAIAETGVDLISVGALTHSAPALDISLDFVAK